MPNCRCCNQDKALVDMVKDSRAVSGYSSRCKACMRNDNAINRSCDPLFNTKRRAARRADPRRSMLDAAKKRAGTLYPCTITVDDIVIPAVCPALGIPIEQGVGKVGPGSPTLDKIIPELGYVSGNVVVVSHLANRIKSNATPAELRLVADFYSK